MTKLELILENHKLRETLKIKAARLAYFELMTRAMSGVEFTDRMKLSRDRLYDSIR